MTLVSDIISAAFREGNLLPIGQSPNTAQLAEALDALNRRVKIVFGVEMGEPLADWLVPDPQRTASVAANFPQLPYPQTADALILSNPLSTDLSINVYPYPPKNSRIVWGAVTSTVYFPEAPDDGSRMAVVPGSGAGDSGAVGQILTLNGNGRTIEGATTYAAAATGTPPTITPRAWFYRADLGDWKPVLTLASGDTFPFPDDLDDYFVCALAIRLAPRFNKTVSAETAAAFKASEKALKLRYQQTGTTVYGSSDIPGSLQSSNTGSMNGW